ncbi:MAG: DUF1772 domain-containing protein [Rhodobacteraceae bacterium]|nr:DUF1772 domain-containing protein [Paracoccaceae bacterium]
MELILTLAGFAAALVAGVFLSFSDFVMRGLVLASHTRGADGMIGLNQTVYRSVFMVMLLGLVPVAVGLSVFAYWQWPGTALVFVLIGSVAYLTGVMVVTAMGNVPMNTRLRALSTTPDALAAYWPNYTRRWTRLNHVRTLSAATTAACWLTAAQLI